MFGSMKKFETGSQNEPSGCTAEKYVFLMSFLVHRK
jgi:hypothetical protein